MIRYLQYPKLREMGLEHFDSWASTFGETTASIELSPEGIRCDGGLKPPSKTRAAVYQFAA
jgi:hypothetical protein